MFGDKKKKLEKAKKKSAEQLEWQRGILPITNIFASFGARKMMGPLADRLTKLPEVPRTMTASGIDDLKKHVAMNKDKIEHLPWWWKWKYKGSPRTASKPSKAIIDKMTDLADLSESMLKEKGLKGKVQVNLQRGLSKNYYNPVGKSVNIGTAAPSVALHEIGHAADYRNNLAKTVLRSLPMAAASIAVPASFGYGDYIKEKIPGTTDDKIIDFIKAHPFATTLGGYTSATLYPEAKASFLALKHMKKHRGGAAAKAALVKELLPAFGTYALGSLPPLAVAGAAKLINDLQNTKKKKGGIKKKASAVSAVKDAFKNENFRRGFAVGAASGGLTLGGIVGHRMLTESGKAMGEVDREVYRRQIMGNPQLPLPIKKKLIKSNKKMSDMFRAHPLASTAGATVLGGTVMGALTGYAMRDVDFVKQLKKLKKLRG